MTSDLDVLRELINENALVRLEGPDYGRRAAVLRETDDSGQIQYSITIMEVPDDTVVIKADAFPAPQRIFKCQSQRGECKRADYVIVASSEMGNFIVYVEMKKNRGGKQRNIVHQLKGSECFVSYCRAIVDRFWSQPNFLDPYESRFVSITKISFSKTKTRTRRHRRTVLHDTPERMLRIDYIRDGGGVPFSELL